MPLSRIKEFKIGDREVDITVVVAARDIFEEPSNHRRRNHVANVLCNVSAIPLECYAHHFAILHHRAAGVSRVDRSIELHGQMGIDRRMSISLEVDPRNKPLSRTRSTAKSQSWPTNCTTAGYRSGSSSFSTTMNRALLTT